MINITNRTARRLYQQEFSRYMAALEVTGIRELRPVLNRQWMQVALFVNQGMLFDIDAAVDRERKRLITILLRQYRRVSVVFSRKAFKIIENSKSIIVPEIKTPKEEFWGEMNRWMSTEAAMKVTKMQKTSKKLIAGVIQKGLNEGESHSLIAKRIRKTGLVSTRQRAVTIARTETHTAAVKSVDSSIASTRIEMEREWLSSKDLRTRTRTQGSQFEHFNKYPAGPDGERVAQDGMFMGTGEALKYPGDSRGSAGNVILCR